MDPHSEGPCEQIADRLFTTVHGCRVFTTGRNLAREVITTLVQAGTGASWQLLRS